MKKGNKVFTLIGIICVCFVFTILSSCKKLIDINPPPTSVTGSSVYNEDATAIAVITGMYAKLMQNYYSSVNPMSMSFFIGLSADEFTLWNGVTLQQQISYYKNDLDGGNTGIGSEFWNNVYPYIYSCNSAIEGLNNSTTLTPEIKTQLLGESFFLRAYFYFYMVNLYGDVPLALSSDYKTNQSLARTNKDKVYQQIISDLKIAKTLLSSNYLDKTLLLSTVERVRPTQWAATALLARTYLYTGKWDSAVAQSTILINNTNMFKLNLIDSVFKKNNAEAIWQTQPVTTGTTNTYDAYEFIIPTTGPNGSQPVCLSNSLMSAFEANDKRQSIWVGNVDVSGTIYYYPYKYKQNGQNVPVSEYLTIFRLAEQYLIRSEANAQLNQLATSLVDLNTIRLRAGLPAFSIMSQADLLNTILHERRVEFFSEFGHRWFDLKRTLNIDAVMGTGGGCLSKGGVWSSFKQLYPLPLFDLQSDLNLSQNNGY